MQPRVTAILVVRNGEPWLDRTLRALAGQTRAPDDLVLVDCASTDGSAELLNGSSAAGYVRAGNLSIAEAVDVGLGHATPSDSTSDWLWLLTADTAPDPDALERL